MSTQEERHAENVERIARLEEQVKQTGRRIEELTAEVHPISDAFQQAKGIKATVLFIGIIIAATIGAGGREILGWLMSVFRH